MEGIVREQLRLESSPEKSAVLQTPRIHRIKVHYSDSVTLYFVPEAKREFFSEDDLLELSKILHKASSTIEWAAPIEPPAVKQTSAQEDVMSRVVKGWSLFSVAFTFVALGAITIPLASIYYLVSPGVFFLILPLIPLLTSCAFLLFFWHYRKQELTKDEKARDQNRTVILALAGFSFTGLLGLAVADATVAINLQLAVFYLLISFLSFYISLNVQSYKYRRWHDFLGGVLRDSASLSLMLAIAAVVFTPEAIADHETHADDLYRYGVSGLAIGAWMVDHYIRTRIMFSYMNGLRMSDKQQKEEGIGSE